MDSTGGSGGDGRLHDAMTGEETHVMPLEPETAGVTAADLPSPVTVKPLAKWPFVLVGVMLLLGAAVAFTWNIQVPYFALSPGPVNDASDFIMVPEEVAIGEEGGDLFFLTVSLKEINAVEYLGALIDEQVDLSPRENIRPAGVTSEELREQNINAMNSSKTNAIYVALTRLGYEVTFEGSGALISSIVEDSAAVGLLEEGDLITAVNGEIIEFSADASELIGGKAPGETVEITVLRPQDDGSDEEVTVEVTLKPFRFVDDDGNVSEEPDRGMVGVLLLDGPADIVFPVEVDIDSQNIGGPSAGLMFTLEIINQLTENDLTRGRRIAGTGTINADGIVGPIGGVRQKVYAAIEIGAEYVLVPAGDYDDALEAAGTDIEVVRIETIDDALTFLEELEPVEMQAAGGGS